MTTQAPNPDFAQVVPAAVLSKAVRAQPSNWMVNAADRVDAAIASSMPSLGAYYRTVTVHGTRRV